MKSLSLNGYIAFICGISDYIGLLPLPLACGGHLRYDKLSSFDFRHFYIVYISKNSHDFAVLIEFVKR